MMKSLSKVPGLHTLSFCFESLPPKQKVKFVLFLSSNEQRVNPVCALSSHSYSHQMVKGCMCTSWRSPQMARMRIARREASLVTKVLTDDTRSMFFLFPMTEGSQRDASEALRRKKFFFSFSFDSTDSPSPSLYIFLAYFTIEQRLTKKTSGRMARTTGP